MNKNWVLTQESFDALLDWLDADRDRAGHKYEDIRTRLIRVFICRACCDPEDLADESINRVCKRLADIKTEYVGDPLPYFYGVAKKVYMESLRRRPAQAALPPAPKVEDLDNAEREHECLDQCIRKLTPNNRQLVLQYYEDEERAKKDHRKELAEKLGIALNALRIRAYRIRASLHECVQKCLLESAS